MKWFLFAEWTWFCEALADLAMSCRTFRYVWPNDRFMVQMPEEKMQKKNTERKYTEKKQAIPLDNFYTMANFYSFWKVLLTTRSLPSTIEYQFLIRKWRINNQNSVIYSKISLIKMFFFWVLIFYIFSFWIQIEHQTKESYVPLFCDMSLSHYSFFKLIDQVVFLFISIRFSLSLLLWYCHIV